MTPRPSRLKVCTILGTRPELIRLSCVMARLDQTLEHRVIHTGQNYDFELNEIFLRDLGIRAPDHILEADRGSVAGFQASVLVGTEKVLRAERPDAVLILGDTNSSIAGLVAKRHKIPIYHMEAGNRCHDPNVPEEINRRLIDHLADFNLCYTEHARRNLLMEGLQPRRIYVTGSPMREVIARYQPAIERSTVLRDLGLEDRRYYLASLHREENVDRQQCLRGLLRALATLARRDDAEVIVSTHPRTRDRMERFRADAGDARIRFLRPFGFIDYSWLQQRARCVLSDSGTISEESAICGFPAVNVRRATERPEALDAGAIILAGTAEHSVLEAVDVAVASASDGSTLAQPPVDYSVTNTSQRVVNLIVGTARLSNAWAGIEANDVDT